MSRFLTDLEARLLPGQDGLWELEADLIYQSDTLKSKGFGICRSGLTVVGAIVAPKGFVTDFASVPRVPFVYEAFGDRAHREAVIHDYLYQTNAVPRRVADAIFLEAMKARGKPAWIRWGMWLGVRLGGASSYKSGPSRYQQLNDK